MATVITDVTELQAMENDPTADYELFNNIEASTTSGWNSGEGFDPILLFTGSFDGKGFTINDLFINRPEESGVGLFGTTSTGCGAIIDVGIVDCDITGEAAVGALIGSQNENSDEISDCYSTGSITATSNDRTIRGVGGLIGTGRFSSMSDCHSTCSVTATRTGTSAADNVSTCGGLIGSVSRYINITQCYATGAVTATGDDDVSDIGGFIGNNNGAHITKCYATGDVAVTAGDDGNSIGGFVGYTDNSSPAEDLSDCYARGAVTVSVVDTAGSGWIGGFVGANHTDSIMNDCYSTGLLTITASVGNIGGFCGGDYGTISDCFWDTTTSGMATSDGGTGQTTAEMKTEATFIDAGWDFVTAWTVDAYINNGYPSLGVGTAPTVTTQAVSSIADTTATGNGNITDLGSPNPTAHGVCYNTTGSPTTADDTFNEGGAAATGAFTSNMTSLSINTKYYVKAYAANAAGTGYGDEVNFTTLGVPTVTTQTCESVVGATATGRGEITVIGNPTPTAHGHCWNTTADPTTSPYSVDNGAASVIGTFISSITGLTPGTGYYTRAYATNSEGTVYGDNVYFVAPKTGTMGRAGYTWDEDSNLRSFDANALERQYIHTADVDDTPSNGATTDPISSNWAYDHVDAADPHTGYVLESLFGAQTVLQATSNNIPLALTVTEQTLVGRLTGGNIAAIALGISDNNVAQIDGTSNAPTNLDYAKFTASGLEGRSYAQVLGDLSGQAGAAFSLNSEDLSYVGHIGLGNNAAEATIGLYYDEIYADLSSGKHGAYFQVAANRTTSETALNLKGGFFSAYLDNSNTENWTNALGLIGAWGRVVVESGTAAASTIAGAASLYATAIIGDAANDMVLTKYYGLYVAANSLVGNSKLTEDYGIKVEDQEGGATLNYAIHTGAGLVHFGDEVDIEDKRLLATMPLAQGYQLIGTDLYVDDTAIGLRWVWIPSGYHIEMEDTTGETFYVAS